MTTPRQDALEPPVYRSAIDELLALWEARPKSATARRIDDPLARVLYGLAIHVVGSTKCVTLLCDHHHYRSTYPLVRKSLEFAVLGQWLRYKGFAGLEAFDFESARTAKAMLQSMTRAGMTVPADLAEMFAGSVPKVAEADIVRRFEKVCQSFRGGDSLYVMYRHMSKETHPSVSAIAMMLPGREEEGMKIGDNPLLPYYTCAFSMLLALRAADEMTLGKPMKRPIQAIERRLGLPGMLILGD